MFKFKITTYFIAILFTASIIFLGSCKPAPQPGKSLSELFENPDEEAKPWTFWYWMHGEVSKEGITADLEAMKEIGLGGAYIFYIKDIREEPLMENPVRTLSPQWWDMVRFAAEEANRLGLKLGMHSCDGFTCAGGPWITPEKSMQKVVWVDTIIEGGTAFNALLPVPPHNENYYQDIAVFAYPVNEKAGQTSFDKKVKVTTSVPDVELNYLAQKGNTKQFKSKQPCWIQYEFETPFTCHSIEIQAGWYNYHSNRFLIQVSDDGKHFTDHFQMQPPRSGWEDLYANATTLIPEVTSKYFRFVYNPEGMDAGAEDLDAAKWNPSLRVKGIALSSDAKIHQFEGKSAAIWRIAKRTLNQELTKKDVVNLNQLQNITEHLGMDGKLHWEAPKGRWRILRMGHTSTGTKNYVGGDGKGLECDKLNPETVSFQFDQWFGEIFRQLGPELANDVLKRYHVDSWECGSQNWSPVLREEFKKRRGYDFYPYLPVMAGIPVESAETSERILTDLRETIAELVADNFFGTMKKLAHEKDCKFSAESVSPVMVADGMAHFNNVDLPMGEFWYRSPSHDKPNDILDAISGAHVYGKNIVQAESLTAIRLDWDEHPATLKPYIDRNFALGINKLFFHVFTHNPWPERKPGMTLDVIGTYFQRNQTWWQQGGAFIDYISRCQALLQQGKPVTDIAVFTGEEVPRRSVLPDRLVPVLPGLMGKERVENEAHRLTNNEFETRQMPDGVKTLENMADPWEWIDPLNGYAYDSFNKDALLNLATVENGTLVLPGGARYKLLVIPGNRRMAPDGGERMSLEVASKILELVEQGATVLMMDRPEKTYGHQHDDEQLNEIMEQLYLHQNTGRLIQGPFLSESLDELGLSRDFTANETDGRPAKDLAWNHRRTAGAELYFISNQKNETRTVDVFLRSEGRVPEIYNPLTGENRQARNWSIKNNRTRVKMKLHPYQSLFVVLQEPTMNTESGQEPLMQLHTEKELQQNWQVYFNKTLGGPQLPLPLQTLGSWTDQDNDSIKYYSGTASYQSTFEWNDSLEQHKRYWLHLGEVANLAEVFVNGKSCGVAWTAPYRVDITSALQQGDNQLKIEVSNTWANRLIGDHALPEEKRITWTTAPYRLEGKPLLKAGLLGPVRIQSSNY